VKGLLWPTKHRRDNLFPTCFATFYGAKKGKGNGLARVVPSKFGWPPRRKTKEEMQFVLAGFWAAEKNSSNMLKGCPPIFPLTQKRHN